MQFLIPLLLCIFLIGNTACEEKVSGEGSLPGYDIIDLDTFVMNNYMEDAKKLYMMEIWSDSQHRNYDNPNLDTTEIIKVLKLIQAIYDLDVPERDTVFEIYNIHNRYCFDFQVVYLNVNPKLPEIQNLAEGSIPTGNESLDRLLETYAFDSVRTFRSYPDFPWLGVVSDNQYNLIPIQQEFRQLPQIQETDIDKLCIGDGPDITMSRNQAAAFLTFSIGSGDCPAGCIYHKYWKFRISNGRAEFAESWED